MKKAAALLDIRNGQAESKINQMISNGSAYMRTDIFLDLVEGVLGKAAQISLTERNG